MSQHGHPYSASAAIFLDNFLRRWYQPPSELIGKIGLTQNDTVMDFGCGPGFFTVELAKKAKSVVAVDLSPEMLQKAQKKAAKSQVKNIQFLQSDGINLQLGDGSVDFILLVTVFHEVGDVESVLKEFWRVTKPGGRLAIVEVVKKATLAFAPIQNPEAIKSEVEAANFKLQETKQWKAYGIFLFTKK